MAKKHVKKFSKKQMNKLKGGFSVMFFIIGAGVVIFVVIGYLFLAKPYSPNILTKNQIAEYVSSATVTIPDVDTKVQLSNGKGVPDSKGSGYVIVSTPYFSVKTGDNTYDVFTVMEYNLGGSGVFTTIALFEVIDGQSVFKGSYPVGDRVPVDEITGPIQENSGRYEIEISYKDRAENESMADMPTIPKVLKLQISNHEIVNK